MRNCHDEMRNYPCRGRMIFRMIVKTMMMKYFSKLLFAATLLVPLGNAIPAAESAEKPRFLDPAQPVEERARDLISRLTLEEKARLLNHRGTTVERFGILSDRWNQCLHGVCWDRPTTMFPVSIAMAATWDSNLVYEVATAISDEARAIYNGWHQDPGFAGEHKGLIYRGPVINIERNPYWGRNEEAYGEDPYLTGRMGVAYVKGLQGNDPHYLKLVATLKHYAVNNVEKDRQQLSATVPERLLFEYWLPHFRDCIVEGQAQSIMASYNAINGVPSNINPLLLTDILKKRWGFLGFVVSDLGGVNSMVKGHMKGKMTFEDAVAQSLIAGCDFSDKEFETYLPAAVRQGLLPEARLNDAVFRVLHDRIRLGELDPPALVPYSRISTQVICSPEHRTLAAKAAQESVVLLVNRNHFLPLDKNKLKKIAVIGPHADAFTPGGYSGRAENPVRPRQGIKNRAAAGTEILYARGCEISEGAGRDGAIRVDQETGFSGGASVKLEANSTGEYIQFVANIPAPGAYEVKLQYKSFPARGTYRLAIDGVDQGPPVDMYAPSGSYACLASFGTKTFAAAGPQPFRFTAVGRNRASSSYAGHFDRLILAGTTERSFEIEQLVYTTGRESGGDSIAQAAAIARGADVALVYVGTDNRIESEGRDRTRLTLPGRQEELVQAVRAANPRTVVILMNAGPLTIPWINDNVPAIIESWWGGVEGGNATADVLFGQVNPGGRLPHTVYASENQVPPQDEYDVTKGFTYLYLHGKPLFPFGHGLSYTEFEYANLRLSARQIPATGKVLVGVDVKNTGPRAGDEVVQLYVHDVECSVRRPIRELRGFERITLRPGATKTVTFALPAEKLAFYDVKTHDFIVEPGAFDILVGSSSDDIRLQSRLEVK
jgi:beta-glucosidase-like glycosyl hydrolase